MATVALMARRAPMIAGSASLAATPRVAVAVVLCFLVAVVEGFDIQAIGVAAPHLAPELGLTKWQMGWVFSISNIGLVIGAGVGGWLADRVGRKPVFVAAVLIFGLFTLATTLVINFETLFIVRFGAGLGFGSALPNMMAVASEISRPERRALTTAAMFCGMPVGGGVSALVTQLLPPGFDWRVLFVVGGVLPLLLAPALHLLMPETLRERNDTRERIDLEYALFGEGRTLPSLLIWAT